MSSLINTCAAVIYWGALNMLDMFEGNFARTNRLELAGKDSPTS